MIDMHHIRAINMNWIRSPTHSLSLSTPAWIIKANLFLIDATCENASRLSRGGEHKYLMSMRCWAVRRSAKKASNKCLLVPPSFTNSYLIQVFPFRKTISAFSSIATVDSVIVFIVEEVKEKSENMKIERQAFQSLSVIARSSIDKHAVTPSVGYFKIRLYLVMTSH